MRTFMLFIIGATFGAAGGFVVAAANGVTFDGHDHAKAGAHAGMDHNSMGRGDADHAMAHDTPLEVDTATAPTVGVMVTKDPVAGHNLHVVVERFAFAPESVSLAHVEGEGHAHVYVNGVKISRLYGAWMHLDALPTGDVEIEVSLNTNDHRPLMLNGTPIAAKTTIAVK